MNRNVAVFTAQVYSTCRCAQRSPAGNGQTAQTHDLEKSPRYNVAHKLGLRVRPTCNNNQICGKLWIMYLRL